MKCTVHFMISLRFKVGVAARVRISDGSVLAKERKSGAPPLLGIRFSFDVVVRM